MVDWLVITVHKSLATISIYNTLYSVEFLFSMGKNLRIKMKKMIKLTITIIVSYIKCINIMDMLYIATCNSAKKKTWNVASLYITYSLVQNENLKINFYANQNRFKFFLFIFFHLTIFYKPFFLCWETFYPLINATIYL